MHTYIVIKGLKLPWIIKIIWTRIINLLIDKNLVIICRNLMSHLFLFNKLCHCVYSSNHTNIWIHLNLCVHLLQSHLQSSSWRSLRHFAAFDLYVSCSFFRMRCIFPSKISILKKKINVPKFYKIMFKICSCVKKRSIYEIIFFCIW